MSGAISLVALLGEIADLNVVCHRTDATLAVAVIALADERRILVIERTYRPGIKIILDPTEEEVHTAREDDLWRLWNSERCRFLHSAV